MKKVKAVIKKILKVEFCVILIFFTTMFGYYFFLTKDLTLNTTAMEQPQSNLNLKIYDKNGIEIKQSKKEYIKITKLSTQTKNAFIAAEDKRFYKHGGIDLIRVGGAIKNNIKSKSFKEGASTISQQLIKNTQLTSEKTINRKLKEIKLTGDLEKKYSKDEILEMYLNNIYFGNGCYGIESASKHYFNKSSTKLTLAESALLASTINAPSVYNIESNFNKTNERKNLILNQMKNNKMINENELKNANNEEIKLNLSDISSNYNFFSTIKNNVKEILNKIKINQTNSKIKVYTDINLELKKELNDKINKIILGLKDVEKYGIIILNNKTKQIEFFDFKNCDLNTKIEIGSTIKPILVYAPAIEKGTITSGTKILDEKINISGYSPNNSDKKYHELVTVEESLKNSYNVPAVKILNEIGTDYAINFAKQLGLNFNDNDKNLSIALGSISNPPTLKQLADSYMTFASQGKFCESSLISKIECDGKIIYENKIELKQTMEKSTADEITKTLIETTKTGTAKRLKDFEFDVASKTGTVGKETSSNNTYALNVSYTKNHTIATFVYGQNMSPSINGSTIPTMIIKDAVSILYKNKNAENFNFKKENKFINESNILKIINKKGNKPKIIFETKNNLNYILKRKEKEQEEVLFSCSGNNKNIVFEDKTAQNGIIYEYFIVFCDFSNNKFKSNSITLKSF